MSMNQNDDIRYLDIGLPEDIARLKAIGDFENAIREGATLVRIGTAIYGERDYSKKA